MTEAARIDLIRRGLASESPAIRHDAMDLLHSVSVESARTLAREALTDEPDPALRNALAKLDA